MTSGTGKHSFGLVKPASALLGSRCSMLHPMPLLLPSSKQLLAEIRGPPWWLWLPTTAVVVSNQVDVLFPSSSYKWTKCGGMWLRVSSQGGGKKYWKVTIPLSSLAQPVVLYRPILREWTLNGELQLVIPNAQSKFSAGIGTVVNQ